MLYPSPRQRPSAVLAGALLLDVTCGEPPAALHPVVWIGRLIAALEHRAPRTAVAQALYGAGLALAVPAVAAGAAYAGESVAASLVRRSGWPGVTGCRRTRPWHASKLAFVAASTAAAAGATSIHPTAGSEASSPGRRQ